MKRVDITHILGKPFEQGGRGPHAYDCVGVGTEVVRAVFGDAAAETVPCVYTTRIEEDEFPGEWVYICDVASTAAVGDLILTARKDGDGFVHHIYGAVNDGKFATSTRLHGVCILPLRAIAAMKETVVGVYRWEGAL